MECNLLLFVYNISSFALFMLPFEYCSMFNRYTKKKHSNIVQHFNRYQKQTQMTRKTSTSCLYSTMYSIHMSFQIFFKRKSSPTVFTSMGAFTCMSEMMFPQITFGSCTIHAQGTLILT